MQFPKGCESGISFRWCKNKLKPAEHRLNIRKASWCFRWSRVNFFCSRKTSQVLYRIREDRSPFCLKQPEYSDVNEIKRIISKFDDESLVRKIEETSDGVNVYIGEDSEFDPNVTVIKTKYKINGEEGTIAIVGPKRMEYDKVIGFLEYINKEIEKQNNK